eukprot:CAMPEP_0172624518 /NCGR_PEP_ID=MMETSP1068-20121228/137237_1 /TAXON_ID=35684 /ORGANISM="Pseudopedinella elastica, Strain CCMP716" /LENGTH=165 /DNA_ID=CAMNT_0013433509 /DNA_START=410 /DNA_END=907 /DNA_ORIENTATION=-
MPDFATRAMVSALKKRRPELPVFTLVDCNPAGLQIHLNIILGSSASGGTWAVDASCVLSPLDLVSLAPHPEQAQVLTPWDYSKISSCKKMIGDIPSLHRECKMLAEWGQRGIAVKYEAEALFGQGCKYSSCAQFLLERVGGAGSSATNPIGGEDTSPVEAHAFPV